MMKKLSEHAVDEAISYHIRNGIPIYENIFRAGTALHFKLLEAIKNSYEKGEYSPINEEENELLSATDIGLWDFYENIHVPLDYPMFAEEKEPELNKPRRGGNKKFIVYVRDPSTGNVKKVEWGDTTGLKVKISDPAARKSFAARHRCDQQKDKTSAAYWACNTPRYWKQLGLSPSSGGNFYW
jgi:hypothetical protein